MRVPFGDDSNVKLAVTYRFAQEKAAITELVRRDSCAPAFIFPKRPFDIADPVSFRRRSTLHLYLVFLVDARPTPSATDQDFSAQVSSEESAPAQARS